MKIPLRIADLRESAGGLMVIADGCGRPEPGSLEQVHLLSDSLGQSLSNRDPENRVKISPVFRLDRAFLLVQGSL